MEKGNIKGNYRHYKGNEYEVIGEATHTETEEKLVVYKALYAPYDIWVRPYDMFFESVVIDGKTVQRFVKYGVNESGSMYRFSPIENMETMLKVVEYIAVEATKMIFRNLGYTLPVKHVTIFAHYEEEYEELVQLTSQLGIQSDTNKGVKTVLENPIKVFSMKLDINGEIRDVVNSIESIHIHKPNPYRMQVGCCNFEYNDDYTWLASTETESRPSLRRIQSKDTDMVEFIDPNFDVLAYAVNS